VFFKNLIFFAILVFVLMFLFYIIYVIYIKNKKMSETTKKIMPSATLAINTKAKNLKNSGVDVINFAAGEPDFDTPEHIKRAAIEKINSGCTKYTQTRGIPELIEAIRNKFKKDNKIDYKDSEIIVSSGAKMVLYEAIFAITNPGDEILIPDPYWVSYPSIVMLASGVPKFVKTKNFKLVPEEIEKNITKKTKALIINSPNNPTGAVIDKKDLMEIADIAIKNDLIVISDEIYEKIIYDKQHESIASFPEMKERTITINGFSKSYAMTGWRLGYAAAKEEIIKEMLKIQEHSVSCIPYFVQYAGVVALNESQKCVSDMRDEFRKRRDYVLKRSSELGMPCCKPEGAFYAFMDHSEYNKDSMKFSEFLLDTARVAIIPGIAFGSLGESHIRMSYANSMKNLEKGFLNIEKAIKTIK